MSNVGFENRMISTSRNIRQRCQLKYSKHGTFTWVDKIFFFSRISSVKFVFLLLININSRTSGLNMIAYFHRLLMSIIYNKINLNYTQKIIFMSQMEKL